MCLGFAMVKASSSLVGRVGGGQWRMPSGLCVGPIAVAEPLPSQVLSSLSVVLTFGLLCGPTCCPDVVEGLW